MEHKNLNHTAPNGAAYLTRPATAQDLSEKVREELLERVCLWLNRSARKQPDKLNAIVLLKLLVEDEPSGLTGDAIERRLNKPGDGWARRQIKRLRDDLNNFRTRAGANLPWRFEIETTAVNVYRAVLKQNAPRKGPEAIWLPHVWSGNDGRQTRMNWLTLTEPISFRDPADTFHVLHSAVTRPDPERLLQKLEGLRTVGPTLKPCSHYVSLGEVHAVRRIENGLKELRPDVVVGCATNQEKHWNELCSENFILIGTRTNELIMAFQETELRLVMTNGSYGMTIRGGLTEAEHAVLEREGGKLRSNNGNTAHWDLADHPGRVYYGIFTRISDRLTRQVKSVISSNHGTASDAIAAHLFSEDVETSFGLCAQEHSWRGLPDNYQMLFKVSLTVGTERKGSAELLMFRELAEKYSG